jgi:hypothetical protein
MTMEVAAIMFVIFMVAIYLNYRAGFKRGAFGGHFVGVHETVEYLVETGGLSAVNGANDKPATAEELTVHILKVLGERRIKRIEELEA